MSIDPYAPPKSSAPAPAPGKPPAGPVKAVLTGLAVDILCTIAVAIAFSIVYGLLLLSAGASQEQVGQALTNMEPGTWPYLVGNGLGLGCSVLGGYVCTRMAQRRDYSLGLILAVISAVLGLLMSGSNESQFINAVAAVLVFASIMAGTWLAIARNAPANAEHVEMM